jgi:hypothetical protein
MKSHLSSLSIPQSHFSSSLHPTRHTYTIH